MNNEHDRNEAILKKLHLINWSGRLLTTIALAIGLLAIAGGILIMWANARFVFPQVNLLVQQSGAAHAVSTNSVAALNSPNQLFTLGDGTKVDQQVLVTLLLGKSICVTSLALTLLGLGTMLTLLLVIFNRRVTLRQVNASLAQISAQIRELQERGQK